MFLKPNANLLMICEHQEADCKILAALLEGEEEDRRLETARRERAIADAAWMKRVIEEQLELEREREAEFDILHRSASRVGDEIKGLLLHFKHESMFHVNVQGRSSACVGETRGSVGEGEESQRATHAGGETQALSEFFFKQITDLSLIKKDVFLGKVLAGRQQQLELKMQKNREAQEESLKRREELIQELEQERELRRLEKEHEEGRRTANMQEIKAQVSVNCSSFVSLLSENMFVNCLCSMQVEQKRRERWEEQRRQEEEEEQEREAARLQEEELRLEVQQLAENGYQEKVE